MLRIFTSTLWWLNSLGVCGLSTSGTWPLRVRRILVFVILLINPYPQMVYLIRNLHDIVEASFSIYYVFVGVSILAQFSVLVKHRQAVMQLVGDIQRIANKRKISGADAPWIVVISAFSRTETAKHGYEHFSNTQQQLDRLLPAFGKTVIAAWLIYTTSPLFVICKAYVTHSVHPELFVAPLRDLYYFFDSTHSPLFEITFAANMLKIGVVCMGFVLINDFFVELCAYVLAMYADLRAMAMALHADMSAAQRAARLRNCVRLHIEIIRWAFCGGFEACEVIVRVHDLFVCLMSRQQNNQSSPAYTQQCANGAVHIQCIHIGDKHINRSLCKWVNFMLISVFFIGSTCFFINYRWRQHRIMQSSMVEADSTDRIPENDQQLCDFCCATVRILLARIQSPRWGKPRLINPKHFRDKLKSPIICWFQNLRFQDTLFELPWIEYALPTQRQMYFMIHFTLTQRVGFSAHKYVYCDIQTFGMVHINRICNNRHKYVQY